jgi:predicted regulator of Ras-like GTPase activity (Roadblock/LC7/MglB family)
VIFQKILDALLASLEGLHAAVLLDNEGETVVASQRNGDDHSHRVLGAYQGIYLRDLARAFVRCGLGDVRSFTIDFDGSRVLTEALQDGYYVVLLASDAVSRSLARRQLARAADELRGHL